MTTPGTRDVPEGWIELSELFIDEVRLGIHAGWTYLNTDDTGECLLFTPKGSQSQAWAIRRNRVLGTPIPVTNTPLPPS